MAVLGQTEVLREDGIRIRTVGKARPSVLEQIPSLVTANYRHRVSVTDMINTSHQITTVRDQLIVENINIIGQGH